MIIRKEDSYKIVGAAMEVYNQLGHGFLGGPSYESNCLRHQ